MLLLLLYPKNQYPKHHASVSKISMEYLCVLQQDEFLSLKSKKIQTSNRFHEASPIINNC